MIKDKIIHIKKYYNIIYIIFMTLITNKYVVNN